MARPALLWVAGPRRPKVEEALRLLDGHRTVGELESCILTKLTKPFVPVNLVGLVNLVDIVWGVFLFLAIIRRHFLACEDIAGGSELSAAVTFFCEIQRPFWWVPDVRWRKSLFCA